METSTTEIYTYWHTLSLHDALPISVHMARAGADVGVGPAPNSVGAAAPTAAQDRRGDEHALRGAIDDFGDRPCGVEPVAVEAAVEFAPLVAVDREPVDEVEVGGAAHAPEQRQPAAQCVDPRADAGQPAVDANGIAHR